MRKDKIHPAICWTAKSLLALAIGVAVFVISNLLLNTATSALLGVSVSYIYVTYQVSWNSRYHQNPLVGIFILLSFVGFLAGLFFSLSFTLISFCLFVPSLIFGLFKVGSEEMT
jgi:hypothetical protein